MNIKKLFQGITKNASINVKNLTESEVNINISPDVGSIAKILDEKLKVFGKSQFEGIDIIVGKNILSNDPTLLLTNNISYRENTVNNIVSEWGEKTWLNIEGGYDTGKSQLSLLIRNTLSADGFWINFRDLKDAEFGEKLFLLSQSLIARKIFQHEPNSNLDNPRLIIMDDLPKLGQDEKIDLLFVQLLNYCKENNIKVLSTSNYKIHTKIVSKVSKDFLEKNVPLLTKEEILEVLLTYDSNDKVSSYAEIIYETSKGYPIYVQVLCRYLNDKDWVLDSDDFIQFVTGRPFYKLSNETYSKLLVTVEDDLTRELLYRLNIVSGNITESIIKLVSSANPVIKKPIEKTAKLNGAWLQRNDDETYSISPLIKRLGTENLEDHVVREINNSLAKEILSRESISQYDANTAILHFIDGESYDDAGLVLISALKFYISNPESFPKSTFRLVWSSSQLPKKMSPIIKMQVRSLQVSLAADLRATVEKKRDDKFLKYVRKDLEGMLSSDAFSEDDKAFSFLILSKSYLLEHGNKAMNYLSKFVKWGKANHEFDDSSLYENFIDYLWISLFGLYRIEDLEIWFDNFKLINKSVDNYDQKSIFHFSKLLCDTLVEKGKNLSETIDLLDFVFENAMDSNIEILAALAARTKIRVLCEKIGSKERAENYLDKIESEFTISNAIFLIKEELGRQHFYQDDSDKALKILSDVIDIEVNYITKIDAYLVLAKIAAEKDHFLALDYTKKALKYGKNKADVSDITIVKLISEYAISLWFVDKAKDSIYALTDAYEKLLNSYENSDEYNITVLRIGSVLNYIFHFLEKGVPPDTVIDGSDYPPPSRGMFSSNFDTKLLNEYFFDERLFINIFIIVKVFEFFDDKKNAIKWANIGFITEKKIDLSAFKPSSRSLFCYKIIQDRYNEAFDVEIELMDFLQNLDQEDIDNLKNDIQKRILKEALKLVPSQKGRDDYLLTYNLILIFIRKLNLLDENEISEEEFLSSLRKVVNNNKVHFDEEEAIEAFEYILENFPTNFDESKELLTWVDQLNIENIKPIQIISYLACSTKAPPLEALRLHLALMPYLQQVVKTISNGAYLFIIYPFVYNFWTNWVRREPDLFYFTELWPENLKRSVEVESKYKIIAMYALVSMHLGYKPNETEQQWMQEYLDEVISKS